MKVSCNALVELFQEIGWKQAPKKIKDDEWTLEKIRAVPKNVQEMEFESESAKELADKIVAALEADADVEFVLDRGDESSDTTEETPKKSKGKKVKSESTKEKLSKGKKLKSESSAKEKPSKGKKLKSESAKEKSGKKAVKGKMGTSEKMPKEKDKWGVRVGSQGSLAMSVLDKKKAKPMSEIVSAAGLSDTCYDFMKKMVMAGHVERTDGGFKLAK